MDCCVLKKNLPTVAVGPHMLDTDNFSMRYVGEEVQQESVTHQGEEI